MQLDSEACKHPMETQASRKTKKLHVTIYVPT